MDSDTLSVEGHCLRASKVAVSETAEEVRLRHTARKPGGGPRPLCQVFVQVNLAQPLGDRVVVDDTSGATVQVRQEER